MRRTLILILWLLAAGSVAGAQNKVDKLFGPRYSEFSFSEFNSLQKSLTGREGTYEMKVPSIFRNKFRKEIIKLSDKEDVNTGKYVRKMADGLEDIYYISFEKCEKSFRDSVNTVLKEMIVPSPKDYCKDSCYVYGIRKTVQADTIKVLLLHVAAQSSIIYLTGNFPTSF